MPGRPDPDALLESLRREGRGRLKVFFGAAAGVGKTYAMLEAAQAARRQGVDVVVGWVETHGRAETEALLAGLEVLPPRTVEHRGATLRDLDLEAVLSRHPARVLVDELAHTNAPDSRHRKRWQDVRDLLEAGIDVDTCLNVQHLESLSDVVAGITGAPVRETVPDHVLDEADEVEFVDLPPPDLLRRLAEGKVYVPEQAERAVRRFFREGNLLALRELALRRTAEHVDAHMRVYRRAHEVGRTWPVDERLLVSLRPNPDSVRLVRAARRLASRLRAPWYAVSVESPAQPRLTAEERGHLAAALKLAEDLGARTAVLQGESVSETVLAFARENNVSRIVVGKPAHPRWRDLLRGGSVLDAIARGCGEIDLYVVSGEPSEGVAPAARTLAEAAGPRWHGYAGATATVLGATLVASSLHGRFDNANLVMVYLLGVAWVSVRLGRGPAALAACLSVGAFDFFFVPPSLTLAVADAQYLLTFAVMLAVGLLISDLANRVRDQAVAAQLRERRTQVLYSMSRELAGVRVPEQIARTGARHVADAVRGSAVVFLPDAEGHLSSPDAETEGLATDPREVAVATWVFQHGRPAGRGTDTLPGATATYLPLVGERGALGVVAVVPGPTPVLPVEQADLLEALARQLAAPLERARLGAEAERARLEAETERLRNTLLSSVSHDLRTPLAAITGAASSLRENPALDPLAREELLGTVEDEARRLNRLVGNLLDMSRLESGRLELDRQWQSLEEVVGSAADRLGRLLEGHRLAVRLPADLPLVPMDAVLVEQVLVNLLENAVRHAGPGAAIEVTARVEDAAMRVEVHDDGPGLPPGAEARVFEKFYRGGPRGAGFGLGLAICRAAVEAHGGRIWAENLAPRGAAFRFTLPLGAGEGPAPVPEAADGA